MAEYEYEYLLFEYYSNTELFAHLWFGTHLSTSCSDMKHPADLFDMYVWKTRGIKVSDYHT